MVFSITIKELPLGALFCLENVLSNPEGFIFSCGLAEIKT
jgi:hypothetical protein